MKVKRTSLGITQIDVDEFYDDRGYFCQTFQQFEYEAKRAIPADTTFVQDNLSISRRGVIRGLHQQTEPWEQGKLIIVLSGAIYDVAVDVRPRSETLYEWEGFVLKPGSQVYIPAGFAHGFQCLSDEATVLYKCTNYYNQTAESPIHYSSFGIKWPITNVMVSDKDSKSKLYA